MAKVAGETPCDGYDGYAVIKNVTNATTDEQIKDLYDKWALNYDQDIANHGYVAHKICVDIFDAEMEKAFPGTKHSKIILDAGAGTGIVGEHLKNLGYTNVDGLDISPEMLKIAKDKAVYQNLICAAISEKRIQEIETGQYDALISSGTITVAHVKACGLGELQRLVKPGGIICFTIRKDALETKEYGYKDKIDELVAARKWEQVYEGIIQYHANAGRGKSLDTCYVLLYKITNN